MGYVTVITLAAAAGGAVAAFTLYQGRPRPTEAAGGPPAGEAQARALPSTPTMQTRLIGALGLLVAVLAGAGLIALLCFLAYAAVKHAVG
jgi:hypothetical protein